MKRDFKLKRLTTISLLIMVVFLLVGCSAPLPGWPGVSANGNRAYVAHGAHLYAVDVPARKLLWSYSGENEANVLFHAAPVIHDNLIVLGDYGTARGMISTGLTVSVYGLQDNGDTKPQLSWLASEAEANVTGRIYSQPLHIDNQIFVTTADNHVLALDATTGRGQWSFTTQNAIWSSPAYANGVVYATSMDKTVYALNAQTGAVEWQKTLNGSIPSTPVVGEKYLYVGSFDGQVHAFDLATGTEAWATTANAWVWGTPTYANGVLYFTDLEGFVFAVDGETGQAVWSGPQQVTGTIQVQPVVVGELLIIGSSAVDESAGYLTAFAWATGEKKWETTLPAPLHSTPVIINNAIVSVVATSTTDALLLEHNLQTGTEQWQLDLLEALDGLAE